MKQFYDLNRHKFRFLFWATSAVCLALVFVFLIIGAIVGQFPDLALLMIIIFTAGIGSPLFIIALGYLDWLFNRKVRKRAYSKTPFDELENIGFSKAYINVQSKWYFTEEIKAATIDGFTVECDIYRNTPKIVRFKALIKWRHIEKQEFKQLQGSFKQDNIEFDGGGLTKMYNVKRINTFTILQLKTDLETFTKQLRQEDFEPDN